MKPSFLFIVLSFLSFTSFAKDCEQEKLIREYKPKYAKLFSIRYFDNFKIVDSKNDHYLLSDKKLSCTTSFPHFTALTKRFIATSTTHLPFLTHFSLEKTLIGFQGTRYIYNQALKKSSPKDIHYQLNPEELLSMRPDLVMAYSANLTSPERAGELRKLGIPLVLNHDFEEKHPLARAEWLVFSATFFSKDEEAQKFFQKIEENYLKIKNDKNKKVILVGEIQNGQWVTCGGQSDLAIMIQDAGGELWLNSQSVETQYISLEKIFQRNTQPDLWLSQNNWQSLGEMKRDSRYKRFDGLRVYNNNALLNSYGFNDFWEMGLMRPDLLLADLHAIIHSGKETKASLHWYKELK